MTNEIAPITKMSAALELVADGIATGEQAATVAHRIIQMLMRSIMRARHEQITNRKSYDEAWDAMQATRGLTQDAVILFKHYPIFAESISEALAVTAYAEAIVLGVMDEKFATSTAKPLKICKTYVIKSHRSGLVKIGRSMDPEARIKGLKTGAGGELETLAILNGDRESELHLMFSDLRVFGEWFSDDGSIAAFLAEEASK